jgi:hypothetical protein
MSKFLRIFSLNPNFLLAHRNRYPEGTDDGQKTPRGHPNSNSYMKNLRVLVFRTDGDINPVWPSLTTFRQVHSLCVGWRNSFSAVLLKLNFFLVHRNRYLEGMDDGQKTPRGYLDFNSYVKILRVFIDNRRANRQTDRQTDGWRN